MKALAKAQLPQLRLLNVCNFIAYLEYNNISVVGMAIMPEWKLTSIKELLLCTLFVTQPKTTSAVLASNC